MIYCKKCGIKNDNDASYCHKCGTKLSIVKEKEVNDKVKKSVIKNKKHQRISKKKLYIGVAVAVIVVIFASFFIINYSSQQNYKTATYVPTLHASDISFTGQWSGNPDRICELCRQNSQSCNNVIYYVYADFTPYKDAYTHEDAHLSCSYKVNGVLGMGYPEFEIGDKRSQAALNVKRSNTIEYCCHYVVDTKYGLQSSNDDTCKTITVGQICS